MSMDDPAVGHNVKDSDMSEASPDDPELALGEILCFRCICHLRNMVQSSCLMIELVAELKNNQHFKFQHGLEILFSSCFSL